ncbi:MAG: beta-lactamase family protein [Planctomycetes bacterium]|nr:beta-lactamase family protein [Planctomycetota bacterium]
MPELTYAKPGEIGLDGERLNLAFDQLRRWTTGDAPPIPGGAIVVGRHGKIVEPRFFGRQGPEADAGPIRRDGMFLLASITKPVTYMAALKLVERGLVALSDPVMQYIPEFAAHHKEHTLVLHLFTHTSGLPDMPENNAELRRGHAPLAKFVEAAVNAVPLFAPGTDFSYQSMGTLVVAEIVQRLSGRTIHEFLHREIFEPLGMTSSGLGSRGLERERLVRVETPEYQGEGDFGWNSRYWQELGAPWGGMFSSPEDFARLCLTLLGGGEWGGVRLLSPGTVLAMRTNRLRDLPEIPEPIRRARPWGLGWSLNHRGTPGSWGDVLGPRLFGHTGATGTLCWIDPDRDGFCLLLTTGLRSKAPWRLVHLSNIIASAFI